MATDWAADVKKYAAKADDAAIAGIVKYCGIALRNRDSALVSFSDKAETDRVRTNFLKKKLGLTQADSVLDAAIAKVGAQMKADRTKNRVTVYYLLASEFNQLGQFVKATPAVKKAAVGTAPVKTTAAKTVAAKSVAKPTVAKLTSAKSSTAKPSTTPKAKTAAKAVGAATLAAGTTAAAKTVKATPIKAKSAPAPAKLAAKPAAAKTVAVAPSKAAALAPAQKVPPKTKVSSPAKATTAKAAAPANNATQGMLDKAASTASDAGKAPPKAAPVAAAATLAAAGLADETSTVMAGGTKPAARTAAATGSTTPTSTTAAANPVDDGSEMGWLWWVIGLAVLTFLAWFLFARGPDAPDTNATEAAASAAASDVGTDLAAAPAEGKVTIPAGAGVTSEMRNGKPVVKVYFETAKTDLSPDFAKTAGGLKSWLDTHSGSSVAISGFSDPSGNAKANADLSKVRAQTVQAGLVAAGIPSAAAMLVKPETTADSTVTPEAARRVEVVVN